MEITNGTLVCALCESTVAHEAAALPHPRRMDVPAAADHTAAARCGPVATPANINACAPRLWLMYMFPALSTVTSTVSPTDHAVPNDVYPRALALSPFEPNPYEPFLFTQASKSAEWLLVSTSVTTPMNVSPSNASTVNDALKTAVDDDDNVAVDVRPATAASVLLLVIKPQLVPATNAMACAELSATVACRPLPDMLNLSE